MSDVKNYFELFEIPESVILDKDILRKKLQFLQKKYHPDKSGNFNSALLDMSVMINEAFRILNNDVKRISYLLKLKGISVNEEGSSIKPTHETLMFILDTREKIDDASNLEELKILENDLRQKFNNLLQDIDKLIINNDYNKSAECAITLQYLDKILVDIKNEIIRYI